MKNHSIKTLSALGLFASAMMMSAPAQAQSANLDVPVSINLVRPLSLTVLRDLSFGPVAPPAAAARLMLTAAPVTTRSVLTGPLTLLPETTQMPVSSAQVRAVGELNAAVSFNRTDPAKLNNGVAGTSVNFNQSIVSYTGSDTLSTAVGGGLGSYTFYMGGIVDFAGGEPGGLYESVVAVTANYN